MKYFRLLAALPALCAAVALHAQQEPDPIPDFSNLDEYFYVPKMTLSLGFRGLNGGRTTFTGRGTIAAPESPGNATDANISRTYHDGQISPDTRTTSIDSGDGTSSTSYISTDGRTNTWSFADDSQATSNPGYIALHTYAANITDTLPRSTGGRSSVGVELAISRDLGRLIFNRVTWNLVGGVTVNDINSSFGGKVQADVVTTTDLYSLFGQIAPTAPYNAPSATTSTVTDASGNPILNDDGSSQTVSNDTTKLLGNTPVSRSVSDATDLTSVANRWRLRGAYFTFRGGPSLTFAFSRRFHATVGAGLALIYAGTDYTVSETFTPPSGSAIEEDLSNNASKLLAGWYGEATLSFDLTARTGLYAGAVAQDAGSYTQQIKTETAVYATRLDFTRQSGFRAGMTVKF